MKAHCNAFSAGVLVLSIAIFCSAKPALAATQVWDNVGTDWGTASNWFNALPGGADTVLFNLPGYSFQPNVGETSSVGGLLSTGSGPLTVSGTSMLTINGATINGNANTGVALEPGAGPLTISAPVTLGAVQQWFNNSGSALNLTSPIANAGYALTLAGSGTTTLSAQLSGTGGLTVGPGAAVVMTAQANYTGATTINGGMLTLQVNGQAPTLAAAGAPAPLVWFDPSNPAGYTLTGGSVTTLMNLSSANSAAVGNAVTESGHGAPSQGDCSISHDPTRTFSRYASSHAAASRLFLMPTLAVDSFFNKPSAARRRMLRLTSA